MVFKQMKESMQESECKKSSSLKLSLLNNGQILSLWFSTYMEDLDPFEFLEKEC